MIHFSMVREVPLGSGAESVGSNVGGIVKQHIRLNKSGNPCPSAASPWRPKHRKDSYCIEIVNQNQSTGSWKLTCFCRAPKMLSLC